MQSSWPLSRCFEALNLFNLFRDSYRHVRIISSGDSLHNMRFSSQKALSYINLCKNTAKKRKMKGKHSDCKTPCIQIIKVTFGKFQEAECERCFEKQKFDLAKKRSTLVGSCKSLETCSLMNKPRIQTYQLLF